MPIVPPLRRPTHQRLAASALALSLCSALLAEEPDPVVLPEQTTSVNAPIITDRFDRAQFTSPAASHYYFALPQPVYVPLLFLPPSPPPLDTPIPLRSPLDTGVSPPGELAAHVYDLFYPQLASRLADDELPRRLRLRLDAYREAKRELQAELHEALASSRSANSDSRRGALAACAQRQAARLEALEASADQLRIDLTRPGMRPPPPGEPAPATAAGGAPDLRFLQAAAYLTEGLSCEQRRLLLSTALEAEMRTTPGVTGPLFFFTPEGASLRIPTSTSPALAALIAAYTKTRQAIVRDLVALITQTSAKDDRKLRQFAADQAPAFAALEAQAEALRQALQAEPGIDGLPPAPPLPPVLAARLGAYREHKQALLRQLNATLTQTVRDAYTKTSGSIAVPASAFTETQQAEIAVLNREKNELRLALAEYHRASATPGDRKSVDNLLEDFERARHEQELREQYRNYRLALFEPGLSPPQRRLLLDAALQELAIPLPSGEPIHRP